ncbi:MAG: hypothetical protein H7288_15350 [Kineosporiaceae bacterium]|nr:hypothetical protein [Aeromicrobium sp.]
MNALAKSIVVAAVANTASLAFAAWIFSDFNVRHTGFIFAAVLFTFFAVALKGIVVNTVNRFARGYTVIGGLVLTWVALLLTDLIVPARGFAIDGFGTWLGVIAIVWAAGIAYGEVDTTAPAPRRV